MNILVLGVTGMLGSMVYNYFRQNKVYDTWGTLRDTRSLSLFATEDRDNLIANIDVLKQDELINLMARIKPDCVINCIGLIKQLAKANDPLTILPINALFPHQLANICALSGARLIHVSTDCVFSGKKEGQYLESDVSDAEDLYGKSKFIGEVKDKTHVITLRTSIIGHELASNYALIDWFLSQKDSVKGYTHAMYSGLPTVELARVIHDFVLPNQSLYGLYQVASQPINKYELLNLVAQRYNKNITIIPDESLKINRVLCGNRFQQATGYAVPCWDGLVEKMYETKNHEVSYV